MLLTTYDRKLIGEQLYKLFFITLNQKFKFKPNLWVWFKIAIISKAFLSFLLFLNNLFVYFKIKWKSMPKS